MKDIKINLRAELAGGSDNHNEKGINPAFKFKRITRKNPARERYLVYHSIDY
jgi:hypothetical protein